MERWVSGLNQRFTKPPALNWAREFESRSLRIDNLLVLLTRIPEEVARPTMLCLQEKERPFALFLRFGVEIYKFLKIFDE